MLLERMIANWKTTVGGAAVTGVLLYVLNSWHCQLPSGLAGWIAWSAAVLPAIGGMLAKDK